MAFNYSSGTFFSIYVYNIYKTKVTNTHHFDMKRAEAFVKYNPVCLSNK